MAVQDPTFSVSQQVVQVRDRWQVTLPADIRRKMGLCKGDVFTVLQIGDTVVLSRKKLVVPELADRIARILKVDGVTLDDLLEDLEKQRQRYYEETYAAKIQGVS